MSIPFNLKLIKSQTQPDGGEGYSGMATGFPVTVPGKEAALLRQGTANARGDKQESSQAGLVGRACNTRRSPLSILSQIRILGAHVWKDTCSPREICHDVRQWTDRTVRGGDHVAEVSKGHSSWWKRAGPPKSGRSIPGGLTPTKARTVPGRMVWVNGRGCQRACSYRHIAAVAERSVAFSLNRAQQAMVLSLLVMTSRTAGYAIRMSGGVGGAPREGRPYPYSPHVKGMRKIRNLH